MVVKDCTDCKGILHESAQNIPTVSVRNTANSRIAVVEKGLYSDLT
jgi:hypothetical protein